MKNKVLLIMALCVVVILVGGFILFRSGKFETVNSDANNKDAAKVLPKGVMSLVLDSANPQTFKAGDPIFVNIIFSTDNKSVIGVDAVVDYDANKMAVKDIKESKTFDDFLLKSISKNVVAVSGVIGLNSNRTVKGDNLTLASFTVIPKSKGILDLKINFAPFQTNESNIVEMGSSEDVLGKVNNLSITVN